MITNRHNRIPYARLQSKIWSQINVLVRIVACCTTTPRANRGLVHKMKGDIVRTNADFDEAKRLGR